MLSLEMPAMGLQDAAAEFEQRETDAQPSTDGAPACLSSVLRVCCLLQVVESVDLAFLDACFHDAAELPGRDMSQVPHPLITDTLQRLKGLTAETAVVLVHMNHSNPVLQDGSEQRAAVLQAGFQLGQQGAVYEL